MVIIKKKTFVSFDIKTTNMFGLILFIFLHILTVQSRIRHDHIHVFKNLIYNGKETFTSNEIPHRYPNETCQIKEYVRVIKTDNCLPVYILDNMCTGLCESIAVPRFRIMMLNNDVKNKCVSCSPSNVFYKNVYQLCRKDPFVVNGIKRYYMDKKKIAVVKACSCTRYICVTGRNFDVSKTKENS